MSTLLMSTLCGDPPAIWTELQSEFENFLEDFFKSVTPAREPTRELEMTRFDHVPAVRRAIGEYLAYYNLERKHSSLDYLSPHQFELHHTGPTTGRI